MRIAVVGSGISGLTAAWLLSRKYDVELFEARRRLGGHTHTVRVDGPEGPVGLGCLRPDGGLRRVVAEVNDTFGDTFCYLLDEFHPRGRALEATSRKRRHVSPFIGMEDISYEWLLTPPGPLGLLDD